MTERGWSQAFDPKSKGKYPWGEPDNIFIGEIDASELQKIYGYSGNVLPENQTVKVNIVGSVKDVLSNLRMQRILPRARKTKLDTKFIEAFAFTSTNISEVGTYNGENEDLKAYFDKLSKEIDDTKQSDVIDIDKLVSAYVIGRSTVGIDIEILDANGEKVGLNGENINEWRYPIKNVFIHKVEGVKKFNTLLNGGGGFDITKLNTAVKPKKKTGQVKYKPHDVKVVNDIEKSVERTKRQVLPYKIVFSTLKKTYTIPEGRIIVGSRAALDVLNRELVNYAKYHKLDEPQYYIERKRGDKKVMYSEVKKSFTTTFQTAVKENSKDNKTSKSGKSKTESSESLDTSSASDSS
jgi:hypothetical protein